jgi:hypothetical protein
MVITDIKGCRSMSEWTRPVRCSRTRCWTRAEQGSGKRFALLGGLLDLALIVMRALIPRFLMYLCPLVGVSCFKTAPTVSGDGDSTTGGDTSASTATRGETVADSSSASGVDADADGSASTTEASTSSSGADATATTGAGASSEESGVVEPCVHHVFVTSVGSQGDLGGFIGADDLCVTTAQSVNQAGDWVAVLSGITVDAADRFTVRGRVCDMNDQLIAADATQWWSDSHDNPINVTEDGEPLPGELWRVWTATDPDGSGVAGPGSSCSDWTSTDVLGPIFGNAHSQDTSWIREDSGSAGGCANEARLYCFR